MAYAVVSKEIFDIYYVNKNAKVVIVGISPGSSQSFNPFYDKTKDAEYNNQQCAFRDAKKDTIHKNLINMLDEIGIDDLLKIDTCSSLWYDDFHKINFISVLPYSVIDKVKEDSIITDESQIQKPHFINGIEFESIQKHPLLKENYQFFLDAIKQYNNETLYVACGPSVYNILLNHTSISNDKIIPIAHPSGPNGGRIKTYIKKTIKDSCKNDVSYHNALALRLKADEVLKKYI